MEGMFDNVDWQSYALCVVIVVLNRSDDLAHDDRYAYVRLRCSR